MASRTLRLVETNIVRSVHRNLSDVQFSSTQLIWNY